MKGQHVHVHGADGRTVEGTVRYVHPDGALTIDPLSPRRIVVAGRSRPNVCPSPPVKVEPVGPVVAGFPIRCECRP